MKMRLCLRLTILTFVSNLTYCQNRHSTDLNLPISDVFMKIPIENFTDANKEELLKNQRIDSISDDMYATLDIDSARNILFIQSCFYECGSCPCYNYSINSYKINDSSYKIAYSSYISAIPGDGHRPVIKIYNFETKGKTLEIDSISPKEFPTLKDFFLKETPESVIINFSDHGVEVVYYLDFDKIICEIPNADNWQLTVDPFGLFRCKWFKGNRIEMKWDGTAFVRGNIIRAEIGNEKNNE